MLPLPLSQSVGKPLSTRPCATLPSQGSWIVSAALRRPQPTALRWPARALPAGSDPTELTPGPTAASSSGRQLPNGVWWLDPASAQHDVLYGGNGSFVLQRARRGGPGLVHSPGAQLARRSNRPPQLGMTVAGSQPWQQAGGGLAHLRLDRAAITDGCIVIDTEAREVAEDVTGPDSVFPPSTCLGMVLLRPPPAEAEATFAPSANADAEGLIVESSSDNPRRTKKIKFTCNLCGTTNIRPVNPHAWTKGSVFGRCRGCKVIHKLTDNLKVFHELKGAVFPAVPGSRASRQGIVIPPSLPQNPGMGADTRVGGFKFPTVDSDQ